MQHWTLRAFKNQDIAVLREPDLMAANICAMIAGCRASPKPQIHAGRAIKNAASLTAEVGCANPRTATVELRGSFAMHRLSFNDVVMLYCSVSIG